jgi:hypothetical protein
MGLEFLNRVRRTSLITAFVLYPVISIHWGLASGGAWLLGCGWSLVNIYVISLLVGTMCADPKNHGIRLIAIILIKIPALYTVGYILLKSGYFPVPVLFAGFMWPLSVIVLKALGRLALRLDDRAEVSAGSGSGFLKKRTGMGRVFRDV